MTDKELIHNLKGLKKIKPSKNWVVLTKSRILAEEEFTSTESRFVSAFSIFKYRLALAPVMTALIIIGLFGFAQSTTPGDFFFSIKKITETVQVGFSSTLEKPRVQLQMANKRLEELSRIAESNQVEKLEPAIKEFQASVDQAVQNMSNLDVNVTSSDAVALRGLVEETRKLSENKEKVESVLGAQVGSTEELESALGALEKETAKNLIADLEKRTLTEEKQKLLERAEKNYEEGFYQEALYELWQAHNFNN